MPSDPYRASRCLAPRALRPRTTGAAPLLFVLVAWAACAEEDPTAAPNPPPEVSGTGPLTGTWRLHHVAEGSGIILRVWWAMDLRHGDGALAGQTTGGREEVTTLGSSTRELPGGRPVSGAVRGEDLVLTFDYDSRSGTDTLRGRIAGDDRLEGPTWVAERVTRPGSPTDLRAAPFSSTEAELTWTDNATRETGFRAMARCCGTDEVLAAATFPADATFGVLGSLSPGVTYEIELWAIRRDLWQFEYWTFRSARASRATVMLPEG